MPMPMPVKVKIKVEHQPQKTRTKNFLTAQESTNHKDKSEIKETVLVCRRVKIHNSDFAKKCIKFWLESYLDITAAGLMLHIVLGADLRLGLVLEVHFERLDLFIAAAGLMGCILQRTNFRFCIPLQLCCYYLQIGFGLFAFCGVWMWAWFGGLVVGLVVCK